MVRPIPTTSEQPCAWSTGRSGVHRMSSPHLAIPITPLRALLGPGLRLRTGRWRRPAQPARSGPAGIGRDSKVAAPSGRGRGRFHAREARVAPARCGSGRSPVGRADPPRRAAERAPCPLGPGRSYGRVHERPRGPGHQVETAPRGPHKQQAGVREPSQAILPRLPRSAHDGGDSVATWLLGVLANHRD